MLEIGAGTGLNVERYPPGIERLVLSEPDPGMAQRLERRAAHRHAATEVVHAPADALPFSDGAFDTVVCTLVLCTVPDQGAALREVRRVLRPEGRLLFIEHVRAHEPGLARWQDRFDRPWSFLCAGCHANRDTAAAIEAAGFEFDALERGSLPKASALARPLIQGAGRRS